MDSAPTVPLRERVSKAVQGTPRTKVSLACETDVATRTSPLTPHSGVSRLPPAAGRGLGRILGYRHTPFHRTLLYRASQILHSLQIKGNIQNMSEVCPPHSVRLGCRNEALRPGGFDNRHLFSHGLGGWKLELGCRQDWLLPRPLSLVCTQMSSPSVLSVSES